MEQVIQLTSAVDKFNSLILSELHSHGIKCWVAGGAIRDYFMAKPITTDIDIFFPDSANQEKARKYLLSQGWEIVWESENGVKLKKDKVKVDLVKKYFPSPTATIEEFDFTVSMFAIDGKRVYFHSTTFIDLAKRQLMINKLPYPASTLKRAFRYYTKGFRMCTGEMRKLIEALSKIEVPPQKVEDPTKESELSTSFDALFSGID